MIHAALVLFFVAIGFLIASLKHKSTHEKSTLSMTYQRIWLKDICVEDISKDISISHVDADSMRHYSAWKTVEGPCLILHHPLTLTCIQSVLHHLERADPQWDFLILDVFEENSVENDIIPGLARVKSVLRVENYMIHHRITQTGERFQSIMAAKKTYSITTSASALR